MRYIYSFFIQAYSLIIWAASHFHVKALLWVDGRKDLWTQLDAKAINDGKWYWFHAASLGEFEQGRPVIEALRLQDSETKILLTFFSPSGYEIRKNYDKVDMVAYLPIDTLRNARKFVSSFPFKAVFFIKYEFWFNYMKVLHDQKIPLYYISAKFRKSQHFFAWYGVWFKQQLSHISHFFVQDAYSALLLEKVGLTNVTITGDTRFDRVDSISQNVQPFHTIEQFKNGSPLLIAGSTWPPDEQLLFTLLPKLPVSVKMLVAPHDVSPDHVQRIVHGFGGKAQLYSNYKSDSQTRVIIIDSIGLLSRLYQYADIVYIGGGFGASIHNIQEPVSFGCPVVFGPNHKKFTEAVDLLKLGGAFEIKDFPSLSAICNNVLADDAFRNQASQTCIRYVKQQLGATNKIISYLTENRLV